LNAIGRGGKAPTGTVSKPRLFYWRTNRGPGARSALRRKEASASKATGEGKDKKYRTNEHDEQERNRNVIVYRGCKKENQIEDCLRGSSNSMAHNKKQKITPRSWKQNHRIGGITLKE